MWVKKKITFKIQKEGIVKVPFQNECKHPLVFSTVYVCVIFLVTEILG